MILWICAGLVTAWLMYHDKKEIPVVKAILVSLLGIVSLVVWGLYNIGYKLNNPMIKAEPQIAIPANSIKNDEFEVKTKKKK